MKYIYILALATTILFACKNSRTAESAREGGERQNFKTQNEVDEEIIKKHVAEKKLNGKFISGGIYAIIADSGKGERNPTAKDNVTVKYKGYFLNGNIFDQSKEGDFTFMFNSVIQGWGLSVAQLKKGGSGTFIIPSSLAYGPNPNGQIPANAVLAFDITLVDIK
ncbi:MAG: FKBP-type peptidyl-prolyl cis-trans isomerase [Bacteroidota bacterium]|nr:FKBP-type peptidyl-prolyl cis-trans isomerase [Bacteroidota bacterium]